MKRLFILSAAVAALASCSNSEVITEVNEPQVPDKAIAFETFSSNATRADDPTSENSGQSADKTDGLNLHHNNFQVWGYKDVQTTYVFDRVTVSYTAPTSEGQTGRWNYSPIHFWDKNANSYEFYACAPATTGFELNKNEDSKQKDDYFTLSDVTLYNTTLSSTNYSQFMKSDQVSNSIIANNGETTVDNNPTDINTDYMIANACKVENTDFGSPVQLHFNHILSRLNITVKKGETLNSANAKLDVVSLEVNNMAAKGSFDEHATATDLSQGSKDRWTVATNDTKVNYVANALENVTDNEKYILQSLVLPQEVEYEEITLDGKSGGKSGGTSVSTTNKPYIKIVYKITTTASGQTDVTEAYTAYYNLAAVFVSNATSGTKVAFNEGWQNTLNITIDAAQITFTPDVYEWKDTDPSGSIEIGKVTQIP